MITVYNDKNSLQWTDLFTKAWEELYKDVEGNVPEPGRFLTLDEFFAKIGDLSQKNYKYLMLPIDEEPFKIDANTRAITVPPSFTKCAGVVGDNFCEIATFVIDRYFDYKDLGGENIQIAIHWKNPNNDEGISEITLKDYDYEYGKIRFGWPLTSNIACASGNVQFSVRFYEGIENPTTHKIEPSYLLNTLTASIPIKAGLTVTDAKVTETNIADTLASFVTNSRYLQAVVPVAPTFDLRMGGINLPTSADLIPASVGDGEDDYGTLTLEALAISPEGFPMTYIWCLKKSDGTETSLAQDTTNYTIADKLILTRDTIPNPKKTYYSELGTETYVNLTSFEDDKEYYEKGSSLTINNTDHEIVGKYYVQVQSENNFTDETTGVSGTNKSSLINSNQCEIAEPEAVILQGPALAEYIFIDDTNSLKITANSTDATYKWYKTTTKPTLTEENPIINDTAPTQAQEITNLTPGWYQGQAIVSKNRFNKEAHTEACKVVNNPVAPNTDYTLVEVALINGEWETGDIVETTQGLKEVKSDTFYQLTVTPTFENDDDPELLTSSLEYKWLIQDNEQWRELTEVDKKANGILESSTVLNGPSIILNPIGPGINNALTIQCKITNVLGNKRATTIDDNNTNVTIANMVAE